MTKDEESRLAALESAFSHTGDELVELFRLEKKRFDEEVGAGSKRWGRWRYSPTDPHSLDLIDGGAYEVVLDRLDTVAKLGDWLLHLADKNWVTAEDLGNLVLAVRDLHQFGYCDMQGRGVA
jgi:hypothetical protein